MRVTLPFAVLAQITGVLGLTLSSAGAPQQYPDGRSEPHADVARLPATVLAPHAEGADIAAYRHLIDGYRDGVRQGDALVVPSADLSLITHVVDPASGWTAADLAAAAMLHTDVTLRLVKRPGQQDAAAQVDAAMALLRAAVERDPGRASFVRRWRGTVAGLLDAAGARSLATRLETETRTWLAESSQQVEARAAFASGLTDEIRAAVAGPLSGAPPKRTGPVSPEARRALLDAANDFQDALAREPTDAQAALHLGRIMIVTGREIDADRPLRTAAAAPDRPVRYLALMFLGAIAERQSRFADAERHYRAALDAFAWGQSAPLALSHLLMRDGREAEARTTIASHFARAGSRVVDPLWTYLADPATDLGPTLNLLRAEVWR
jgi:tetratricopeptide (TPR) repeat protein